MKTLNLTDYLAIIEISGNNAESFLQSQLTNDVTQLKTQSFQWQAYCNREGLVQVIFGLFYTQEKYYAILSKDLADQTVSLLKKYGQFVKVNIQKLSQVTIELQRIEVAEKNIQWQFMSLANNHCILAWQSHFTDAKLNDDLLLRWHFIQHQFPWLQAATTNQFRPHDLSLPKLRIVNFKKGCYPGQEIIARMEYRGKPKYHLINFEKEMGFNSAPGIPFEDAQYKGWVVDSIEAQDRKFISAVAVNTG